MSVGVDQDLLLAWLTARSLSRQLPPPVAEHGGYRVETRGESEFCRWVFAKAGPQIGELGREIHEEGRLIKLCGTTTELSKLLPSRWTITPTGFFMRGTQTQNDAEFPPGYQSEVERSNCVSVATVRAPDGDIAASGFAAETDDAFVYDRIGTRETHRRRGLGRALMALLGAQRRNHRLPELLVASPEGFALYSSRGWEALSPYATAEISGPAG
ncbi:MAG: GNAT family N-acetyltransferase [Croceibacterium sp.]